MYWCLASPDHHQQCYCLCIINRRFLVLGAGEWFRPPVSFIANVNTLYVSTVNPARPGLKWYKISSEIVLSGRTLHRFFNKQPGTRQNAGVISVAGIRSKIECNTQCVHRSDVCMGFNFQRGPPFICEFSRIPHDAPNSNMVIDSQWDHYAIIPWMENTHFHTNSLISAWENFNYILDT